MMVGQRSDHGSVECGPSTSSKVRVLASVGTFDNTVLLGIVCGNFVMVYVGEFQEFRHDG